jgi:hypothetical protein
MARARVRRAYDGDGATSQPTRNFVLVTKGRRVTDKKTAPRPLMGSRRQSAAASPRAATQRSHANADEISFALSTSLRRERCISLTRVRYAVLENDGDITISLRAQRRRYTIPPAA